MRSYILLACQSYLWCRKFQLNQIKCHSNTNASINKQASKLFIFSLSFFFTFHHLFVCLFISLVHSKGQSQYTAGYRLSDDKQTGTIYIWERISNRKRSNARYTQYTQFGWAICERERNNNKPWIIYCDNNVMISFSLSTVECSGDSSYSRTLIPTHCRLLIWWLKKFVALW